MAAIRPDSSTLTPDRGQAGVFQQIVEQVRAESLLAVEEVAELTEVGPRQVRNWVSGSSRPGSESRDRLLELSYLVGGLAAIYTPEGVEVWLHGRNRSLSGERPIDLLRQGRFDEVRREAERLHHGVAT